MQPDGNTPAPTPTDGGATPAVPAPAEPVAPVTPAPADPTPAPKTIDPVDHSKPADPAPEATPAPADPANPDPAATPPEGDDDAGDPTIDAIAGDQPADDLGEQINKLEGNLPSGVNPDGTIDPLIYAYEQIPTIQVKGKVGNGKVETYEIKTADDLPDNFRYADAKEQSKALTALQENVNLAKEAINDANTHNANRTAQLTRQQTHVAQKNELEKLQESGRLPKFTMKPTDTGFMETPEAKRAQEVLSFMAETNKAYKDAGVNQEITSVTVALDLLEAKEAREGRDARMGVINDTRTEINSKVNGGNSGGGTPQSSTSGQTVHKDIQAAIAAGAKRTGLK